MNLYLVQHGAAMSKEENPERPLTEGGRSDVATVADFAVAHRAVQTRRIFHSGKTRAQETAEVLAERLGSAAVERAEDLAPLADPAAWAERLGEIAEGVMLVGHLPHLSRLAATLLSGDADRELVKFEMGGIVCLVRDEEGSWSLRWMVTPSLLGEGPAQ